MAPGQPFWDMLAGPAAASRAHAAYDGPCCGPLACAPACAPLPPTLLLASTSPLSPLLSPSPSPPPQTGSQSAAACLTDAGYGWEDGSVNQCEYGYYNAGENQNRCSFCGDFFNTTQAASAADGEMGSDSDADCKLDLGYQAGTAAGTIEPCLRGWYKDLVGNLTCTQCPAGTSTTITMASVARSDCDTCRPGFGVGSGSINLANPSCSICVTGTYSPGFKAGGEMCSTCPQAQNFTGEMVSRQGAWTPEDCYGEFITDSSNAQNFLWWDIIAHSGAGSALVDKTATAFDTLAECQVGCGTDNSCQYFEFYATGSPSGVDNSCFWRVVTDLTAARIGDNQTEAWWNVPTGVDGIVLFEIREGSYVVYPKVATEVIGTTLNLGTSNADFKATRTACDKAPDCIGLTWDGSNGWRPFKGALWEDAVGKVRVVGDAINTWANVPTGTEEPEGWSPTN